MRLVGTCTANLREDRGGGFYVKENTQLKCLGGRKHPAGKAPKGRAFQTS